MKKHSKSFSGQQLVVVVVPVPPSQRVTKRVGNPGKDQGAGFLQEVGPGKSWAGGQEGRVFQERGLAKLFKGS